MEIIKLLLSGAVGAGIVTGIFGLLGKLSDHRNEERKEKRDEMKTLRSELTDAMNAIAALSTKIEGLQMSDQALMKAVNALLLHNMSGNATGKMAAAQQELTNYIIEHGVD